MPVVTRHEPGSFCWAELATSDSDAAKRFYVGLFGWSFEDSPAGPDMVYTMLQKNGKAVGALYRMRPEQKGMPPNWGVYFTVASVDDTARRAAELGAGSLMAPFNVMDVGRMAVLQDPQGATFSIWEARKHIGAEIVNEPGAICWCELETTDTAAAGKFYTGLFGWNTKIGGDYTEFLRGPTAIGGMMRIPKEWGPVPPHWLTYFEVTDCDAMVGKAQGLGATPIVPPMDIPGVGRFSVLKDPQGAVFAVVKLDPAFRG